MLRHVVLIELDEAADPDAVVAALRGLPAVIPELRGYVVGRDAGLATGNATVAVVADLDDADAWRTYLEHPEHQRVLTELVKPHLVARTAVQHQLD